MTDAHTSPRVYLAVWGWLAGLMLISVLLSELPIPKTTVVLLVLMLSTIKALLVALYYMHLKVDRWILTGIAVFPLLLVGLAVLLVLSSKLVRL